MKYVKLIIKVFTLLVFLTTFVDAKDSSSSENALNAFQDILNKHQNYFNSNPKLLLMLSVKESPTSVAYEISQFIFQDISYDIQTTNSIITPYIGYIDVKTKTRNNNICGNIKRTYDTPGWDNIDDALNNAENASCYIEQGEVVNRYHYAYQNGKWIFKDVTYANGSVNGRIMSIYGKSTDWFLVAEDQKAKTFNQEWFNLIK